MSAERSLAKTVTYDLSRVLARLASVAFFQMRVSGREFIPENGGGLVCANHQSFFDPVLFGMASDRRLNYLARDTLFDAPAFGHLIRWYDAIPIQRDGFGITGIKETLRRLRQDELVLIFPEGTRTYDGEIGDLKPGICALARRGRAPLVPVAIEGAFQAWPRGRKWPRMARMAIAFGPSIAYTHVKEMSDQELIDSLRQRMLSCHAQARRLTHSDV